MKPIIGDLDPIRLKRGRRFFASNCAKVRNHYAIIKNGFLISLM